MLQDAEGKGFLHSCRVGRGASSVTYLLFTDDVFRFFCASIDESRAMKHMLLVYEEASGQAINFGKSGFMCNNNMAHKLVNAVSFILWVTNPIDIRCYLGLLVLVRQKKEGIFAHSKDCLWRKL